VNFLKQLWNTYHNNPLVVFVYTSIFTALYAQAQAWFTTGSFNASPAYWEKIVIGAVFAGLVNVYHLGVTPQGTNPSK
jgi:hypothetical protein